MECGPLVIKYHPYRAVREGWGCPKQLGALQPWGSGLPRQTPVGREQVGDMGPGPPLVAMVRGSPVKPPGPGTLQEGRRPQPSHVYR